MTPTRLDSITIRSAETRSQPKPHTVYAISCTDAHQRSWTTWKRYNDFLEFHTELSAECKCDPPLPLPPKNHSVLSLFGRNSTVNDEKLIDERKEGLERYLRSMLVAKKDVWRSSAAFTTFLSIPVTRSNATEGYNLSSWLEERSSLESQARSVRALLSKRDAQAAQGDSTAAHTTSVEAKKALAGLVAGVTKLAGGLDTLAKSNAGMSEGELRRRSDMVTRLQDEMEICSKLANAFQTTRTPRSKPSTDTPANNANREALIGSAKPTGRVLGKAAAASKETEVTRALDNHGLLQLQQQVIEDQDDRLSSITAVIRRQKELGHAIYNELEEQNVILDEMSEDVDRTGRKLGKARDQLKRL